LVLNKDQTPSNVHQVERWTYCCLVCVIPTKDANWG